MIDIKLIKKKNIFSFLLLIMISLNTFGQVLTIQGTVVDNVTGESIIGAVVEEKNTNTKTITDTDGAFSIQTTVGAMLDISYVGYLKTSVKATNGIVIRMKQDSQDLDEVVVVGYGTQKKGSLTGAISAISSEDLVTTKNENVQNMITGKVPGVRVVQNTAEPGEFNNSFDIRGMGAPLIIVDGIPRDNMTRLDPQDIENISVLKDASAAIYGVRAANGVVLITTKRGKEGTINLEYSGNFGFQFPSGSPKSALAADAMTILNEKKMHNVNGGSLRFSDEEIAAYRDGTKQSTDWYDEIMKSGVPQTQHNVSISGGTDKIQFYSSMGYDYQQSFIRSGDVYYEKFNMRSNITAKPFKNLTVEANMAGILENNHKSNYDTHWIIRCMQRSPSYFPVYANDNPNYLYDTRVDDNPYAQANASYVGYRRYKTKWIQTSSAATYNIPGIDGLSLKGLISYDYQERNNKVYWNQFHTYTYDAASDTYNGTSHNGPNRVRRQAYFRQSLLYQLSLQYQHKFEEKHNVGALFLLEGRDRKGDNFYAQRNLSMPIDHLFAGDTKDQIGNMNSGQNDVYHLTNLAYIGRLNYDYMSKYLFEFSFRYDGSSMFAKDNRWGFFPGASAGWRVSEEEFWKNSSLNFINNFKVRVSYGKLGDDTAAAYQYISGYNYPAGGSSNNLPGGYVFNGSFVNASTNKGIPNEQITWYTAKTFNVGIDLDF
jgi:TonB-linked SusC/RagA family outer membrane protein